MWHSRVFSLIVGSITVIVESGNAAREPYDAVRLAAVENKAKSMDLDDASAILDVVHDTTRQVSAAAHSDKILEEARADLWRKKQDMRDLKVTSPSQDAVQERKRALADAAAARNAMKIAAKSKVKADIRLSAAERRVEDAQVHIEESLAKKDAAKKIMSGPLAKLRTYHATSEASGARVASQNKRADAEERDEEAMAFVRADKEVKGSDHYKAPAGPDSENKPDPAVVEAAEDQKEAESEMATAMQAAKKKVRGMLAGTD